MVLLLFGAAVFFTNLASPLGLHQNDEDYYLGVARTMAQTADWIVPVWDGSPSFVKPPLLYWLMSASITVLGPTLFAARLPVALLAVLVGWMTAAFGRRLLGSERGGLLAGFLTLTTVGFFQYGRVAMMDIPLTFCALCAAWSTWEIERGRAGAPYTFFAAVACGVLLKGPVAAFIFIGGAVGWLFIARRVQTEGRCPWWHMAGGLGMGTVLIAAWPLALYCRGLHGSFINQFLVGENLAKFSGVHGSTAGMLGGFAALLLPWTLLAAAALVTLARSSRHCNAATSLPLCFVAANVLAYALPAVKWAQYLLPSVPFLALLVAWTAVVPGSSGMPVNLAGRFDVPPALKGAALVTGGGLIALASLLAVGARLMPEWSGRGLVVALAVLIACSGVSLLRGVRLLLAAAFFSWVMVTGALLAPALSLDRLPPEVKTLTIGRELMTYGVPPYGFALALGRPVGVTDQPDVFRTGFERGVLFIVGGTQAVALIQAGRLDAGHARALTCWRKWRGHMSVGRIVHAVFGGSLDELTEDVCLMEYSP